MAKCIVIPEREPAEAYTYISEKTLGEERVVDCILEHVCNVPSHSLLWERLSVISVVGRVWYPGLGC